MADQRMQYCLSCDVYVGVCDGEMVIVTGDAFRQCLEGYYRSYDPHSAEVYEPIAWLEDAVSERDQYAWLEPDESRKSYGWYCSRDLEELHDHSLWLGLVSQ